MFLQLKEAYQQQMHDMLWHLTPFSDGKSNVCSGKGVCKASLLKCKGNHGENIP